MSGARLGLVVGLVLAAAACGGGDDAGPPSTSAPAGGDRGTTTARVSIEIAAEVADPAAEDPDWAGITLPGAGLRTSSRLVGVVDFAAEAVAGELTWESEALLPEGAVDEPGPPYRSERDVRFLGADGWAALADGTWVDEVVEEEPDDRGGPLADLQPPGRAEPGLVPDPRHLDPAGVLDRLTDEVGPFRDAGEEDVRGVPTTRRTATVVVAESRIETYWPADLAEGTVEIWVDAEGRLRRLEAGSLRAELWDFGVPVAVEEPSPLADGAPEAGAAEVLVRVTGPWEARSRGTTAGVPWTLHSAAADQDGTPLTCYSAERDGAEPRPDLVPGLTDHGLPDHDGNLASCSAPSFSLAGVGITDPALVAVPVFSSVPLSTSPPAGAEDERQLVALVVSPRYAGPLRLVRADGSSVELVPDGAGVAMWEVPAAPDAAPVVAVTLDGGAVVCGVEGNPASRDPAPDLATGLQLCVAAEG